MIERAAFRPLDTAGDRLIDFGYRQLEVPPFYPLPEWGQLRVLAGLAAIIDLDSCPPIDAPRCLFNSTVSNVLRRPYHSHDPLAALLAGLVDPPESTVISLLKKPALWPQFAAAQQESLGGHRQLALDILYYTVRLIDKNKVKPIQPAEGRIRSGILERIWMYRSCLEADDPTALAHLPPEERMLAARGQVEPILVARSSGNRKPFCDCWLDPRVSTHAPPNPLDGSERPESQSRRHRSSRGSHFDATDPEDIPDIESWEPPAQPPPKAPDARARWFQSFAIQSALTPGPMPDPGCLSRGEMTRILQVTSDPRRGAGSDLLIRLIARSLVSFKGLLGACHHRGRPRRISVRLHRLHENPLNAKLFRSSHQSIRLALTEGEAWALRQARKDRKSKRTALAITRRLSEIVPGATLAKFEHTLYRQAHCWWGVPWGLVVSGMTSHRPKAHAVRSYVRCDQALWRHARPYRHTFWASTDVEGCPYRAPWGSALVPRTHIVRQWFSRLAEIGSSDPPRGPGGLLSYANRFAALTHIGFLLLEGLRMYPMDALGPELLHPRGWDVVWQKQHPSILTTTSATSALLNWATAVSQRIARTIADMGFRQHGNPPYAFMEIRQPDLIVNLGCTSHLVQSALGCDIGLRNIPEFARNPHRHWSNTILRQSGLFSELAIQAFHHHHFALLQPLARHRLEPIVDWSTREAIASYLATQAGIPGRRSQ